MQIMINRWLLLATKVRSYAKKLLACHFIHKSIISLHYGAKSRRNVEVKKKYCIVIIRVYPFTLIKSYSRVKKKNEKVSYEFESTKYRSTGTRTSRFLRKRNYMKYWKENER